MERTLSVEEKIRRAEEIYARRQEGKNSVNTARVSIYHQKKDIKLLKKMVIQVIICLAIYLVIYVIQNGNYIFSQDFLNKINEIISYDTNFLELYEDTKNLITNIINEIKNQNTDQSQEEQQEEQQCNDENIGGATIQEENIEETESKQDEIQEISQTEQDIQTAKNTTSFIKPINGVISSKYGQRESSIARVPKNHTGIDLAANTGTKILSSTSGEVVLRSEEGDYGKHLKIQIGEISVIYAHCNEMYVNQGDRIEQGQEIAEVGTTGNSTGPHLHFEIRVSERTIDPQTILEF